MFGDLSRKKNVENHSTTIDYCLLSIVHPVMLDILTERNYEEYGEDAIQNLLQLLNC